MKKLLLLLPFVLGTSLAFNSGVNSLTKEVPTTQSNGYGPVEINQSVGNVLRNDGNPLTANGVVYPLGFGTNANSKLTFKLDGKCTNFTTKVDMDDDSIAPGYQSNGVIFKIFVNGVRKYRKFMDTNSPTDTVSLDITGAKNIFLVVDNNGNSDSDHADWLAPTITCNSTGGTLTIPPLPVVVVPPAPSTLTFSGPLVITQGGTYSGNYQSLDNGPVITVNTTQPVIIQNSVLKGGGDIITAPQGGANLTVRNVKSFGVNPNVLNKFNGGFVNVFQVNNLIVENNYYEGSNGIIVNRYTGDNTLNNVIRIKANYGKNITGMYSDGNNGWKTGASDVYATHAVILDSVTAKNVEIAYNRFENEVGKSAVADIVNVYHSSGFADSYINIHDNYLKGAYNYTPLTNVAYYGGGIILQDGTSSGELNGGGGFVIAQNNTVINTTNYGLQTQDGHDTKILNNRVFETGKFDDGTRKPFVNTGIVDYRVNKGTSTQTEELLNHYVQGNYIQWVKFNADNTPFLNGYYALYTPYYDGFPAIKTVNFANNTVNDTVFPAANIAAEYNAFTAKVSAASLVVGPQP